MRRAPLIPALLLLVCVLAAPAAAEVYTWTDAHGRVHMTDDLSNVPPEYRRQANDSRRDEIVRPPRWNDMNRDGATTRLAPPASRERSDEPVVHVLRVDRAGSELSVWAELDGGMRAPFIVDTGAMINTIPAWVVEEMGIVIDEDTPATFVRGISGQAMFVPVITLRSVSIGGAEVEDVELAVLSTQSRGLLGMPFFNHFKVSTDPSRGTLTLEEIDLNGVEGVYGGQNERAWRHDFRFVQHMLDTIERRRESVPDEFSGYHEKLDKMQSYWELQLDELELKASRAGVPPAWRE